MEGSIPHKMEDEGGYHDDLISLFLVGLDFSSRVGCYSICGEFPWPMGEGES